MKESTSMTAMIDETVLGELKSIMDDEFGDVLHVFLDESVTIVSEIHVAFEEESENLEVAVDALKSCSNNVGATRLGEVAETMQDYLAKKNIEAANDMLEELQDVFAQSHSQIKKYMKEHVDKVA